MCFVFVAPRLGFFFAWFCRQSVDRLSSHRWRPHSSCCKTSDDKFQPELCHFNICDFFKNMLNYIWSIRFINISSCHLLSCEFKLWRHRFVHCSNAHDNQSVNCAVSFFFGHKSWVGPQAGICQGLLTHYDEVGVAASPGWGVDAGEHGTEDGGTQQECLAFAIISKYSAFGAMKSIKAEHFTA